MENCFCFPSGITQRNMEHTQVGRIIQLCSIVELGNGTAEVSTYLSSNTAEPSSNSSSTDPTDENFFVVCLWTEFWHLPLKNRDLNLFWCFLGEDSDTEWSGGSISTTRHVVSSFKPLALRASWSSQMDNN